MPDDAPASAVGAGDRSQDSRAASDAVPSTAAACQILDHHVALRITFPDRSADSPPNLKLLTHGLTGVREEVFSRMNAPKHGTIRLEVDGFIHLLHEGRLAASPMAEIIADPFAYGLLADAQRPASFTFSDIPDLQFRKPRDILRMSHFEGGSKS